MSKVESLFKKEEEQTVLERLVIVACNQVVMNLEKEEKLKQIDEKFQDICEIDTYFCGMVRDKFENVVAQTLSFHIGIILDSIENYRNTLESAKRLNESENQQIMEFFKQELPDVHAKLRREFAKKRKGIVE